MVTLRLLVFTAILSFVDVAVNGFLLEGGSRASIHEDMDLLYPPPGGELLVLPENYSALIPPPTPDGKPTKVDFSVVIMNVRDVNEKKEEMSIEMNLRAYWTDSRLKNMTGEHEYLVLNPSSVDKYIWRPDVFIDRVKNIPTPALLSKPASLRLFPDGSVRYSARITVILSCSFDYKYYPADTQNCNIDLKSYAYPNDIVLLGWHGGVHAKFGHNVTIPNFMIKLSSIPEFSTTSSSGVYSGIRFTITLKRLMSYHMLQTYAVSFMFMLVSWLTFIVPQDCGAVAICMTTLLTTTALFSAVRQNSPAVSYAKAIDIWMVVCIFFIFLSLFQHTVTLKLRHIKKIKSKELRKRIEKAQRQAISSQEQNDDPPVDDDPSVLGVAYRANGKDTFQLKNVQNENPNDNVNKRYSEPPKTPAPPIPKDDEEISKKAIQDYKILGNKIRKIFSLVTPISFFIFNMIYWPWLMRASEYLD